MPMDEQALVREVLYRAAALRAVREKRATRILAMLSGAACLVFVVALSLLLSHASPAEQTSLAAPYNAGLSSDAAWGGYALIGVVAFALGVVFTLFCVKRRDRK